MSAILSLRDVGVRIGGVTLVSGLNLDVGAGEVVGLVGESGSGKSLTMRAILRLLPHQAAVTGQILWQGRDLAGATDAELRQVRGRQIAMVSQEPMTALNPVLTIGLQITESLGCHLNLWGEAARRRAIELLDQVGIPDAKRRLHNYPHEFSGGMRQRVMIAIALAAGPQLLLADEPTTALDVTIQDQILTLLLRLKDELGLSVILVTHDLGVVSGTCDRVAVMYAGRVMETGPVEALFSRPAHAYTLGLMRSLPTGARPRQRLPSIPGTPPDPALAMDGCRFAPRCTHADAACLVGTRSLAPVADRHESSCLHSDAVRLAALAPP